MQLKKWHCEHQLYYVDFQKKKQTIIIQIS